MVRKHIKVESARWFYWADRLGLMVWQDMPSLAAGRNASATGEARYETELRRMVDEPQAHHVDRRSGSRSTRAGASSRPAGSPTW